MARNGFSAAVLPQVNRSPRTQRFTIRNPTERPRASTLGKVGDYPTPRGIRREWQKDALAYVDTIEPVGYVVHLTANTVAACDLVLGYLDDDGQTVLTTDEKTNNPKARRALAALKGPRGGIYEIKRRGALLLTAIGETFLLGSPVDEADDNAGVWWEMLSTEEIVPPTPPAVEAYRDSTGADRRKLDPEKNYLARIWRSEAARSAVADCALRRCLDTCRELAMLGQMMEAVITSRLPMGLLLIPAGMRHQSPLQRMDDTSPLDVDDVPEEEAQLVDALVEHMAAPLQNRGSAASLVPLVVEGELEDLQGIRMVEVAKDLDVYASSLRQEMIRRLAIGLDIPPETLEGKGGLNHWCAVDTVQVFTVDGWKGVDDLNVGDTVLTLNTATGRTEWRPSVDVYRAHVVDEPMIHVQAVDQTCTVTVDTVTTLDHRWPVSTTAGIEMVYAKDLHAGDLIPVPHDGHVTHATVSNVAHETYTGRIWCPTVPNGTFLARDNDTVFFTGNTGFQVDNEFLFKHVVPVGRLLADGLTTAYLQPMLEEGEDMKPDEAARWVLTFDPSPIAASADESETAMRLWEAGLISERTVIEKQGWDPDAVMPDDEERARRLIEKLLFTHSPNVRLTDEAIRKVGLNPEWIEWVGGAQDVAQFPTDQPPLGNAPTKNGPADGSETLDPNGQPAPPGQVGDEKAPSPAGNAAPAATPERQAARNRDLLVAQLRVRVDAAVDRALEVAGGRINNALKKKPELSGRFAGRPRRQYPEIITADELARLHLHPVTLFGDAWDDLDRDARSYVAAWLESCGVHQYQAAQAASGATAGLVAAVDGWAAATLLHVKLRPGPDGLRCPPDLIVDNLPDPAALRDLAAGRPDGRRPVAAR